MTYTDEEQQVEIEIQRHKALMDECPDIQAASVHWYRLQAALAKRSAWVKAAMDDARHQRIRDGG
jgi:hypothetical protein